MHNRRYLTCILLVLPLIFGLRARAQVTVQLLLDSTIVDADSIYFAGNLNGWKPGDEDFRFKEGKLTIIVPASKEVQFKLTRGSWQRVETTLEKKDIGNRIFKPVKDTSIILKPEAWKDATLVAVRSHTASKNVIILDTAFLIPQLKRKRTVRMYLPPDYNKSGKRYPVLYMADGQNCFDEYTSAYGEWKIDETLDRFYDSCGQSVIVVAVDNGNELRLKEYEPYYFEMSGQGEGKEYADFVVNTLKPFIDKHYRTKSSSEYTHVAGSSMGGVISMYLVATYPKQVGNAGIFSPAFWTAKQLYTDVANQLPDLKKHSVFFYAGGSESKTMVNETTEMYQVVQKAKKLKSELHVDPLAKHNEQAWSKWFPVYLNWVFTTGAKF
jgi:predicted alpha/beta superfamily hydrolase